MNQPPDDATAASDSSEIERIVFECLERPDPDGAIEALCRARPEIEKRVRAILDWLQSSGLLQTSESATGTMPTQLGPFRLIRELGAGGMGVVYLAEQQDLARNVAVKLIRPEQLFFQGSRERFQREVEAVARLQHPGIVSVFTVGEENGVPFFTMEYVPGRSLAAVIRSLASNRPETPSGPELQQVLSDGHEPDASDSGSSSSHRLFELGWPEVCVEVAIQVTEALQHAHQRGVLHRDVKPSNILITPDGRARLLDFGLARTDGASELTRTNSQIGSMPYLPPEQLDESTRIPSERQDIYSLGVTLYEMLTLRSPFLGETAEATRRNILAARPATIRSLNQAVSWDLETVCMTAMDPDPVRRFASMGDLLLDLRNVRERRPILARRPSLGIRVRRLVQRHPTASAVLLVATVLLAVAAIAFGLLEQSARERSDRLTKEAERRATEAGRVTDFLVGLFEYASPDKSLGEDLPVRILLQQGADRVERELSDQPEVCAPLLATFGRVYSWLQDRERAEGFFRRALAIYRTVPNPDPDIILDLRSAIGGTMMTRGLHEQARVQLEGSLAGLRARHGEGHPLILRTRSSLANLQRMVGDANEAEATLRDVLAIGRATPGRERLVANTLRRLASHLRDELRHAEAQSMFAECEERIRTAYPAGHPFIVQALHQSARNLAALGRFEEAEARITAAIKESERIFGADHPMTAVVMSSAAYVHQEARRTEQAIEALERVRSISERYGGMSRSFFARTTHGLALGHFALGRYQEADALLRQALASAREAFRGDHLLTAFIQIDVANVQVELRQFETAEKNAREGVAMVKRLGKNARHLPRALVALAWVLCQSADPKKTKEAEALANDAIRLGAERRPDTWEVSRANGMLALLFNQRGDGKSAERHARLALRLFESVRRSDHPHKAIALYHLAWALLNQRQRAKAEQKFQASIAMYRRLGGTDPSMAWPLNHYGFALLQDRPADAEPLLVEAVAIRSRVLEKHDRWLLITKLNLGMAYANQQKYRQAEPILLAVHEGVLKTMGGEKSPAAQASKQRLAKLYRAWGKPDKAARYGAVK